MHGPFWNSLVCWWSRQRQHWLGASESELPASAGEAGGRQGQKSTPLPWLSWTCKLNQHFKSIPVWTQYQKILYNIMILKCTKQIQPDLVTLIAFYGSEPTEDSENSSPFWGSLELGLTEPYNHDTDTWQELDTSAISLGSKGVGSRALKTVMINTSVKKEKPKINIGAEWKVISCNFEPEKLLSVYFTTGYSVTEYMIKSS